MKRETKDQRAIKIAAYLIRELGGCTHGDASKCKRLHPDDQACEKCIRSFLLRKAEKELNKSKEANK